MTHRSHAGGLPSHRRTPGFAALAAMLLLPSVTVAEPPPLTQEQTQAVQTLIHNYFLERPEALVEALQRAQGAMRAQAQTAARRTLVERRDELLADPAAPVSGNPQGDVTLVEFFDYRCAYCKKVHPTLAELVGSDPGLRVVHKQLPVLGPESIFAARAALAAAVQDRYLPFHEALMAAAGPLTGEAVFAIADRVGIDRIRLARDMVAPEVEAALARNAALAKALGINGTPSFVVGETLIPGLAEAAALRQLIAAQREGNTNSAARQAGR